VRFHLSRKFVLTSLLLFTSFSAFSSSNNDVSAETGSDISFEQLGNVSAAPKYLKGDFKQEKYLLSIDVSLLSSGQFEYSRNESISWITQHPIQNRLTMTPTLIINQQVGQAVLELNAQTNPAVAVLSDILFSVLTAEWGRLSTYFELQGSFEGKQWQAVLQPTDESVAQFISRVELKGDHLLRTIVLFEKGGDRTSIYFENLSQ
jgi:hypothetical protein